MRKLLNIAAGVCVVFSGCYKIQKPPQAYDVLTRHKWKIESHVNADVDSGADCRVPTEVEFDKDSTGYFFFYTPCAVGDPQKMTFRWTTSYDNKNLHLTNLNGKPNTNDVIAISFYSDDILRLRGDQQFGYFWDGYFTAFASK